MVVTLHHAGFLHADRKTQVWALECYLSRCWFFSVASLLEGEVLLLLSFGFSRIEWTVDTWAVMMEHIKTPGKVTLVSSCCRESLLIFRQTLGPAC